MCTYVHIFLPPSNILLSTNCTHTQGVLTVYILPMCICMYVCMRMCIHAYTYMIFTYIYIYIQENADLPFLPLRRDCRHMAHERGGLVCVDKDSIKHRFFKNRGISLTSN